ncbi:MAG TPA: hypothetical protein VHG30_08050 [Microvirga sp.]|nr:hypothetical protein [Microvirga sp.]
MVFKVDPGTYKDVFDRDGYVLLKDILSDEFLDHLKRFHRQAAEGALDECAKWRISGKKQQYVFDFPSKEAADQFRAGIARLTGMDEDKITISERHLKHYNEDAEEFPAPHKDRHASGISVGLPVYLGPETSVCVFPTLDRSENMAETAVFMNGNGASGIRELYETKGVQLHEAVGDVIVFHGSSMFHERIKPRGTAVLYIKLNDRGEDPLGENIFARSASLVPAE